MFKIGNTNNEGGSNDIEILNNNASAGFKNVMLSFKAKILMKPLKLLSYLGITISYLNHFC